VVRTACSAEEAASVGAGEGVQLIVADYHVGDGANGLEVIAGLRRAAGRDIPAVLVTADTSARVASEARAAGMSVLTKPVARARLRTVVNRICRLALRERARDPVGTRVSRT
jgi:CheY-like chemotaxis protein